MTVLIADDGCVERIAVTIRRSVDGVGGWTTVEVQAEASVAAPAWWEDQARCLAEQLERLVEARLEAQQVRRRPQRGNGRGHLADQFWRAVYGAGLSNQEGHSVLAEAGGDFEAALTLFQQQKDGVSEAELG